MSADWAGPECQMCSGTGVARMVPADGTARYPRCPACNGHGREPTATPPGPHVVCDGCRTAMLAEIRAKLMDAASRCYDLAEAHYKAKRRGNARRCRIRMAAYAWAAGELARGVR